MTNTYTTVIYLGGGCLADRTGGGPGRAADWVLCMGVCGLYLS